MEEKVELAGKPIFKRKGEKEVKLTETQQQVDIEAKEFQESLKEQREELKQEREAEKAEELPVSYEHETEIVNAPTTFKLSSEELANIIRAAQGGESISHISTRMPEDLKGVDKAQYIIDDGLGEVGRGMHRVADGARDIIGGVIDIVTLGRAHRK